MLEEDRPNLSALATVLGKIKNEHGLSDSPEAEPLPLTDTTKFLLEAVRLLGTKADEFFETLATEGKEAAEKFLSGVETAYQGIPKIERAKLLKILATLSLLALLLTACGPRFYEIGETVQAKGQALYVNDFDWYGGDPMLQMKLGCRIDTTKPVTIRERNATGEYYLISQEGCSGWAPHTRLEP